MILSSDPSTIFKLKSLDHSLLMACD